MRRPVPMSTLPLNSVTDPSPWMAKNASTSLFASGRPPVASRGSAVWPNAEGAAGHDHAVRAIAALGGLFGDEGRLDLVRIFGRAEAFLRRHRAAADLRHRHLAGSDRLALDHHRACAALPEAAAEFRSLQPERVAQNVKKRFVRIACL